MDDKRRRACAKNQKRGGEKNRRTRLSRELSTTVRDWLIRTTRVHAHLCYMVRLFGRPETAGGQSLDGEAYAARAARGDRTLLYDAFTFSIDELTTLRNEVAKEMDAAEPTAARPGTPEKVAALSLRVDRGQSLFIEKDAPL